MADADPWHLLPRGKGLLHTGDAVGDIAPQAVVLPGVDPDHKVRVLCRNLYDLCDHRLELLDVIDLLPDKVGARHIRILCHRPEHR